MDHCSSLFVGVLSDISSLSLSFSRVDQYEIDDIINGCSHAIDEVKRKSTSLDLFFLMEFGQFTEELLVTVNMEIDSLSKKISNHEFQHFNGAENVFTVFEKELRSSKRFQHEQKDCADVWNKKNPFYLKNPLFFSLQYQITQRQKFSSHIDNQENGH